MPVAEYSHDDGSCAVTGGFAYRGAALPALRGAYLYGDHCSGKLWGLRQENGAWRSTLLLRTGMAISSFGEDEAGELYVCDRAGGGVYQIT